MCIRDSLEPLSKFVCDGSHLPHDSLESGGGEKCKLWTWKLASGIVDGIQKLKRVLQSALPSYPTVGTDPSDPSPPPEPQDFWRKCPGCRARAPKTDDRHNRRPGECKHPDVASITYKCPGCRLHRPAGHSDHTYEPPDCRLGSTSMQTRQTRRTGAHPRPPAARPVHSPVADAQAQLPDGTDLAAGDEAVAKASSASAGAPPAAAEPEDQDTSLLPEDLDQEETAAEGASSSDASIIRRRGPDANPRHRRTSADAAVGSEAPSDWSRFNIGAALKVLRTGSPAAVLRELRKLHLRWWHASHTAMKNALAAAGIPSAVTERIPEVISTCRECRTWAHPAPENVPTVSLSTQFNQHVETDLMFYRHYIIDHFVDRATRWHETLSIENKTEDVLLEAVDVAWVSRHGPMDELVTDGESGLTSDSARARLLRRGIKLHVRAPGQHARIAERRGAILRESLHRLESQAVREGIEISFKSLLAESTFAGNALINIGGRSPYQALYGRQPAMLPPLEGVENPTDERTISRIRELSLQAMIEATSSAHVTRALRAKTVALEQFQVGDMVEYHRPSSSKDSTGWHGPVEVVAVKPESGQVILRINGRDLPNRIQDVRKSMFIYASLEGITMSAHGAMSLVANAAANQQPGTFTSYGYVQGPSSKLVPTKASRKHPDILAATDFVLRNCLLVSDAVSVRIGNGVKKFPAFPKANFSVVFWWFPNRHSELMAFESEHIAVDMSELIGPAYTEALSIQCLLAGDMAGLSEIIQLNAEDALHLPEQHVANHEASAPSTPRLSTIPEGSNESETASAFLAEAYAAIQFEDSFPEEFAVPDSPLLDAMFVAPLEHDPTPIAQFAHYVSAGLDPALYASQTMCDTDDAGNPCVYMFFSRDMSKCLLDDSYMQPGDIAMLEIVLAGIKRAVIKRETDLLTPDELRKFTVEVRAAILEELKIWVQHNCFERAARKTARNILDSRFVAKWKVVKLPDGSSKRIIRMRMAMRGFKDWDIENLTTYSGTASRNSQKILASEASCHPDWEFLTLDINKAFLQGMTYQEMHELTGEAERIVHFTLPPGSSEVLRLCLLYTSDAADE